MIWVDPNIHNEENSGYVRQLIATEGISLYSTSKASEALRVLKKRKAGTEYRAMTAARSWGQRICQKSEGRRNSLQGPGVLWECGVAQDMGKGLLGRHGSVSLCRVERENKMAATYNVLAFKR